MTDRVNSCQEYFETLSDRFIADQAQGVTATYLYELAGDGGGTWTIFIEDGVLASVTEGSSEGKVNVTYKMKAEDYVDLANGDLNGRKAFFTRKLKVSGSIPLAQKMEKFLPPMKK